MKAYEFPTKVTRDGKLTIPRSLAETLPNDQNIRVILLVNDGVEDDQASWQRLTTEQFFAGYGEADSV